MWNLILFVIVVLIAKGILSLAPVLGAGPWGIVFLISVPVILYFFWLTICVIVSSYWKWAAFLLLVAILIYYCAHVLIEGTITKYLQLPSQCGLPAHEAARRILNSLGLNSVSINEIDGSLTDRYDLFKRDVLLSQSVYDSTSIAAIAVAAHEVGHAVKHVHGNALLTFRNVIVPLVNMMPYAAMPLLVLGFFMDWDSMTYLGVGLFLGALVFHLVTLPVEFDASRRALQFLNDNGLINADEESNARKVLRAHAMKHVAATLIAALWFLALIAIAIGRGIKKFFSDK